MHVALTVMSTVSVEPPPSWPSPTHSSNVRTSLPDIKLGAVNVGLATLSSLSVTGVPSVCTQT